MVEHGAHRPDGQPVAYRLAHVDQQHAHPVGRLGAFLARSRAAQQHHQVRMLRAADPDLLTVDHVIVAVALSESADSRRIGARTGFGHAKGLQSQFAAGDLGQVFALLLVRSVLQQRAHGVHLRMAGTAVGTRPVNFLKHGTRRLQPQARAVIFFRDEDREEASLGQSGDEFARIGALAIEFAPVFAGEARAQTPHRFADFRKGLAQMSVSHCNLFAAHRALWQRVLGEWMPREDSNLN